MFEDIDTPKVTMVRVLLVLAIAVPILIEVVTFGGLIGHYVGGEEPSAAGTPTPEVEGTDTGETILPETAATERVGSSSLVTGEDSWRFVLTVEVTDVETTYELLLGAVTTRTGTTVDGSGSTTGTLSTGESGTVTGAWLLPPGERPATLTVTVATTDDDGTEYTVEIGEVSVEGSYQSSV